MMEKELEQEIYNLIKEKLGINDIFIHSNFFDNIKSSFIAKKFNQYNKYHLHNNDTENLRHSLENMKDYDKIEQEIKKFFEKTTEEDKIKECVSYLNLKGKRTKNLTKNQEKYAKKYPNANFFHFYNIGRIKLTGLGKYDYSTWNIYAADKLQALFKLYFKIDVINVRNESDPEYLDEKHEFELKWQKDNSVEIKSNTKNGKKVIEEMFKLFKRYKENQYSVYVLKDH